MKTDLIEDVEDFSLLTRNALRWAGIHHISDLSLLSKKDLSLIPSIGKKGKGAIIEFCEKRNIQLNERNLLSRNAMAQY